MEQYRSLKFKNQSLEEDENLTAEAAPLPLTKEYAESEIRETFKDCFSQWQDEYQDRQNAFNFAFLKTNAPEIFDYIRNKGESVEKYMDPEAKRAYETSGHIKERAGQILQRATDIALKIIDSRVLISEKLYKININDLDLEGKPDLAHELEPDKPLYLIDCKIGPIDTNGRKLARQRLRYAKIINAFNPSGGYVIFLYLLGDYVTQDGQRRKLSTESWDIEKRQSQKVHFKYWNILHFFKLLESNNRRLVQFLTGCKDYISQDQVDKITEIRMGLEHLRALLEREQVTTHHPKNPSGISTLISPPPFFLGMSGFSCE